ncbi:alpha/beta fold hydrolase [Pseudomonas sp. NR3]|uniref:alpha/beta fold hydrolase n=1 Tax=Pseudomonas sp. NR3 TaxID=3155978 RepID=UPI003B66D9D5
MTRPLNSGYYPTDDGHRLYWERHGTPGREPMMVLHGGPGGRFNHRYLELVHLHDFDVIVFDQRGCGRSTSEGDHLHNNTSLSVLDIEALREHFGFKRINLLGVSWGSWLAIQYQRRFSHAVLRVLLASVFVPSAVIVKAYDRDLCQWLASVGPVSRATDPRQIFDELGHADSDRQRQAAVHWLLTVLKPSGVGVCPTALARCVDHSVLRALRLELHFHLEGYFFTLADTRLDSQATVTVVQGLKDRHGIESLRWLKQHLNVRSILVEAGHNALEPAIAEAMRRALTTGK